MTDPHVTVKTLDSDFTSVSKSKSNLNRITAK